MSHCRYFSYNTSNFLSVIADEKDLLNLATHMQLKKVLSKYFSRIENILHRSPSSYY